MPTRKEIEATFVAAAVLQGTLPATRQYEVECFLAQYAEAYQQGAKK